MVKGITHFGAFVELPDARTGLVHISEVAEVYVKDIREFISVGDRVKVKVLTDDGQKVALSIKQANSQYRPREPRRGHRSLDEMLSRFLKESEEKQAHLRRREGGRAGRGGKSF